MDRKGRRGRDGCQCGSKRSQDKKKRKGKKEGKKTLLFTGFTGRARDEEMLGEGSMVARGRDNLVAM